MALFLGLDPLAGALLAAVIAALLIGGVRLYGRAHEDTLIGALWAIGMAVGILFMSRVPGYQADLVSYLFGNILLVPTRDLWLMGGLDAVLLLVVGLWHRQILAVVFDEEQARLRGLPVNFLYLLLLVLIALTVVLLIHLVGLIMVLALLTLPAAIAGQYVHSLTRMMWIATLLNLFLSTLGLAMSYTPNLPPGPAIVLLTGLAYVLSTVLTRGRRPA